MNVFVLICVFLTSNGVQFVDQPFSTMKECQIAANQATEILVSKSINQGSVTCVPVTLGSFA